MSLRAKQAQLRRLGIAPADISTLSETELDSQIAAETQRRREMYLKFAREARVSTFVQLGVQVLAGDGDVYSIGEHDPYGKTNSSAVLGPLAGAEAHVTARTMGPIYALAGSAPVAMAAGRAAAVAVVATPGAEISGDPMDRLRKLLELLDAGLLTEQEYEARRLTIIDSL
jgi:hypothetical protein